MNVEFGRQPNWQRLGEIELQDWESDLGRANVRTALVQSVSGFVSLDEMQTPLENAIFDAIARKAPAKPADCGQRLVISCLNPPDVEDGARQDTTGWSFFLIERPAITQEDGTVEVIELCLYHE